MIANCSVSKHKRHYVHVSIHLRILGLITHLVLTLLMNMNIVGELYCKVLL